MTGGMMEPDEPDKDQILRDVIAVSDRIIDAAVAKLDGIFGDGCARGNPELLGKYFEVTAQNFEQDLTNSALAAGHGAGFLVDGSKEFN